MSDIMQRVEQAFKEYWNRECRQKFDERIAQHFNERRAFLAGRKSGMEEAAEIVTNLVSDPSACVSAAIRARMEGAK